MLFSRDLAQQVTTSDKHFAFESSGGRNELFEGASPLTIAALINAQSEAQRESSSRTTAKLEGCLHISILCTCVHTHETHGTSCVLAGATQLPTGSQYLHDSYVSWA